MSASEHELGLGKFDLTNVFICSKSCLDPNQYVNVKISNGHTFSICEKDCKKNYYLIGSNVCQTSCESKLYKIEYVDSERTKELKICIPKCNNYWIPNSTDDHGQCVPECPADDYVDGQKCVSKPSGKFYVKQDGRRYVVESCDRKVYPYEYNNQCFKKCPDDARYVKGNECQTACQGGYFYAEGGNLTCTDACNRYFVGNENDLMSECVDECPSKYSYRRGSECVVSCEYRIDGAIECLAEKDLCQGSSCVTKCPESHPYEIDLGNGSHLCVQNCSAHVPAMYSDGYKCVSLCSENQYVEDNQTCSSTCESGYFVKKLSTETDLSAQNRFCVDKCEWFIIPLFNASNNISECTLNCPSAMRLFGRYCLKTCQNEWYLSEDETTCSETCSTGYYEERLNGKVCLGNGTCKPGQYQSTGDYILCKDTCSEYVYGDKCQSSCE